MASVPDQQPDIVLFCEGNASNGIRVPSDIDRILRIASNSTFSTALVGDRIATVVREVSLHYTRRALLVQWRRMPCLLDSCAGRCVVGRQVVPLSDNVEGAMVTGRADGDVRDEASTDRLVERIPGSLGGPAGVARDETTSSCYGRNRSIHNSGLGYRTVGSEGEHSEEGGEHSRSGF